MTLVRFSPLRELEDLLGRYGQGIPDPAFNTTQPSEAVAEANWRPPVDVRESADFYEFRADLPAVEPEQVEITVRRGVLTIAGERRSDIEGDNSPEGRVHRLERRHGRFSRSFTLPEDADADRVSAQARNGVLAVRVEKKSEVTPRRIEVQVA